MPFYCGIDQGKRSSDICVIDETRQIKTQVSTKNDLGSIVALLSPYRQGLKIVVESSSTWYWLIDGLHNAGFENVVLAHSSKISMITKAKVKTDRRDARTLAELLMAGYIPEGYIYPKDRRWLRDTVRLRQELVSSRTAEFLRLKTMAARFGHNDISRNDMDDIEEEDIKFLLKEKYLAVYIPGALKRMDQLSVQIRELDALLEKELGSDQMLKRMRAVPGLGRVLSLSIFLECGELSRFENPKGFCSYCRVAPGIAQSGRKVGRGRGNKQGNSFLKNAFMQAAVAAVRCYPDIRAFFDMHQARRIGSGGKRICYNIVAHKLALAVFKILKGHKFDQKKFLATPVQAVAV